MLNQSRNSVSTPLTWLDIMSIRSASRLEEYSETLTDLRYHLLSWTTLLEYVQVGPPFSNQVLQTLSVLVRKVPPISAGKKFQPRIVIVGTTNNKAVLQDLGLVRRFQVSMSVPMVRRASEISAVMHAVSRQDLEMIGKSVDFPLGIKNLLVVIEAASQNENRVVTADEFMKCLATYTV
jgi:vesicle-fusing ATPase